MSDFEERINLLQQRLENLAKYQQDVHKEIASIHFEIKSLKGAVKPQPAEAIQQAEAQQQQREVRPSVGESASSSPPPPRRNYQSPFIPGQSTRSQESKSETGSSQNENSGSADYSPPQQPYSQPRAQQHQQPPPRASAAAAAADAEASPVKSDLEKFIGENLISKIGIVITVLGVAIGAKYAIDNNLISPFTRIVLGYLFGFGLLAIAVRLKEKYLNFSAVLLSGAMAIQYFITFAAYSFYALMSQSSAFALMLIFTVFTVLTAIRYNRQVIAHIGLVGAYTIPFLLSDGSGNYAFLFSYITIINVGILAISIKKYWKSLYYSSFIVTWATFAAWYFDKFDSNEHLQLALIFPTVFFLVFYLTFLAYKAVNKEAFTAEIVFLVLANSFIFYGFGCAAIESSAGGGGGSRFLGLFTIGNALVHFLFSAAISRYGLGDKGSVHLTSALVLTFVTIAVPVQFRGNWTTLLWTAEAAILFGIGRTRRIALYEYFSYPLMALASVSLWYDWQTLSGGQLANQAPAAAARIALFNADFLTAILFVAAFAFIYFLNRDKRYEPAVSTDLLKIVDFAIPAVLLFALYNTFRIEIGNYWHYKLVASSAGASSEPFDDRISGFNRDVKLFNVVWQINYTLFFLTVLSAVNIKRIKSPVLAFINLGLNVLALVIFLVGGLYSLGELRESYLQLSGTAVFNPDIFHILTRYLSLAFVAALIFASYEYLQRDFVKRSAPNLDLAFDFVLYVSLWIIASNELVNWMDVFGYSDSYKLGLSILWGIYSLFLIVLGINRNKKHLRVGAIVLFAITLAKVFLYDIADLDTISKTVVFVSLGVLLLLTSFLYNKYKHLIIDK